MTEALSLFDYAATRGASRADGPETSRAAGRSLNGQVLRDQQRLVLHVLDVFCRHDDGGTAFELWEFLTDQGNAIKENVCAKRLGELVAAGMARLTGETRPGSSHRQQKVYAVTEQGRSWIAAWLRSAS